MPMSAQTVEAGTETILNTTTDGDQGAPDITLLDNGNYVVTWYGINPENGNYDVFAQTFNTSGQPVGEEFRINTYTFSYQTRPAITALNDGGHVIVWESQGQDGDNLGIYGQRFNADGTVNGEEFHVSTHTTHAQYEVAVASFSAGGYIVTWSSYNQDDNGGSGVFAQLYNAQGDTVGDEFQVNTSVVVHQETPAVAVLSGGGFVITWHDYHGGIDAYDIYAQRYFANGERNGSETMISLSSDWRIQYGSEIVAMVDGGYLITWQSQDQDGDGYGIYARRYDAEGNATTGEVRINTTSSGDQMWSKASVFDNGSYVVVWQTSVYGMMDQYYDVYAQVFTADGHRIGTEIKVNSYTGDSEAMPEVQILNGTSFAIVWRGANDNSDYDIHSVTYTINVPEPSAAVWANTYTDSIQTDSHVTVLEDGAYVVTWFSYFQDGDQGGVYGQVFNADGTTRGGEFQIPTQISSGQNWPSSAALPDGGFVVTWTSESGGSDEIYTQSFDSEGNRIGVETRINNHVEDSQNHAKIAAQSDGGWIITWTSWGQDSDGNGIYAQMYHADGTTNGEEFRVNTTVVGDQVSPEVAVLTNGETIIAWEHNDQVYFQRYTAQGAPTGDEQLVNPDGNAQNMSLTALTGGGFVLAWQVWGGETVDLYVQRYGADATPLSETPTRIDYGSTETDPVVTALAWGGYVLAWTDSNTFIMTQAFTADGHAVDAPVIAVELLHDMVPPAISLAMTATGFLMTVTQMDVIGDGFLDVQVQNYTVDVPQPDAIITDGGAVQVNTYNDGMQALPTVATLDDGGYVITWMSVGQDGSESDAGVYAQMYNADGTARGAEFRVNTTTQGSQAWPESTALSDGGFLIAWLDEGVSDGDNHVFFRRFDADGHAVDATDVQADTNSPAGNSFFVKSQVLTDGDFVMAWSTNVTETGRYVVQGQRFAADGTAQGEAFQVGAGDSDIQFVSGITALSGGGFVITYERFGSAQVLTQTYDADGLDVGEPTVLATAGLFADTVALSDGGYIIAWMGIDVEETYPLTIQRFNAAGEAMDETPLVLETLQGFSPTVAALADGAFAVAYMRLSDAMLCVEVFDSAGQRVGDLMEISTVQVMFYFPVWDIAATSDGFVITWSPEIMSENSEVFAQSFTITLPDYLSGNSGDNLLDATGIATEMRGLAGDDTYVVDSADDLVTEFINHGTDLVESSISYTLTDHVEDLTLTGTDNIDATGNALDNVLAGNSGVNVLSGGAGNDTYHIQNSDDAIIEAADEGVDTVVTNLADYSLGENLENLILTGSGNTEIWGNGLNNELTGNDGNNVLYGNAGDDCLDGGAGSNTLQGGEGSDTYVVRTVLDYVMDFGTEGVDLVEASTTYVMDDAIEDLVLTGSSHIDGTGNALNNILTGNSRDNVLTGNGGNDRLDGGAGSNLLQGGEGSDTYVVRTVTDYVSDLGTTGIDVVEASMTYALDDGIENLVLTGTDNINGTGHDGANSLTGNSGSNRLNGGAGADTMAAGAGDDMFYVDNVNDVIVEAEIEGTDTVRAAVSYALSDHVERLVLTGVWDINGIGNDLNNRVYGNIGNNALAGGAGNDSLKGGAGADTLTGGLGNDCFYVDNVNDVIVEAESEGSDTVQATVSFMLSDHVEILVLTGASDINGIANDLNNRVDGNIGNNALAGGAGNDSLNGGAGADTLTGGLGNDVFYVDNANDFIVEAESEGSDSVKATVSYTLSDNVEILVLAGMADINGTGNDLDNRVYGNAGNNALTGGAGHDSLIGGAGADTLTGGLGNDSYYADNVNDVLVEAESEGTDTVRAAVSYALSDHFEQLVLTGASDINGIGNDMNNRVYGNIGNNVLAGGAGNDSLNGGAGADTFTGGLGNDVFYVDNVNDIIVEAESEGTDTVQATVSCTLSAHVERLVLIGATDINGTGNDLNNRVYGNDGNNALVGGAGNDSLKGGAGADTLTGGLGSDVFYVDNVNSVIVEAESEGTDTVRATVSYTLSDHVEQLFLTGASDVNGIGNDLNNLVNGNDGANIIDGRGGSDSLFGKGGADVFRFLLDSGVDVIKDFSQAQNDKIDLSSYTQGVANLALIEQQGAHTFIDLGQGNTITVQNTNANNLSDYIIW